MFIRELTMIEQHLQSLRDGEYSRSTVDSATKWLSGFSRFCNGRNPLELTSSDLVRWHQEFTWTPGPSGKLYSEGSTNQAVGAVRRFYRWARAQDLMSKDPTKKLFTPKAKRVKPPSYDYSPSQRRKLLSSPDLSTANGIRDRAVFALLLETRMGYEACSSIDRSHLQFDTGALLITRRKQRIYSLSEALLTDIERYLQESRPLLVRDLDPALFLDRYGARLSAGSIHQTLLRHRRRCNL